MTRSNEKVYGFVVLTWVEVACPPEGLLHPPWLFTSPRSLAKKSLMLVNRRQIDVKWIQVILLTPPSLRTASLLTWMSAILWLQESTSARLTSSMVCLSDLQSIGCPV